jgi:hypothetical protein
VHAAGAGPERDHDPERRVSDQHGGALPGTRITARELGTNASRTVHTGDLGQYFLPNLPPSPYEVTAALAGFSTARRPGLTLRVDQQPDNADRRHNLVVSGNYSFPWVIDLAGVVVYRSAPPWSVTTLSQLDDDPFPDRPEPRNSRRGDGFSTVDVRAVKSFQLGTGMRASALWEVYNLFNTDSFYEYSGRIGSSLFGLPTAAYEKRRQQGGIRIDF